MIKVYWIGYGGNSSLAEALRPLIESLGMSLKTIHEWDNADIKWNGETWLQELKQADIIIIPANYQTQPAKSNNRLTQAMSLGKPCICSPMPSYLEIINEYPDSAIVAETEEEWKNALIRLQDKQLRNNMSIIAREVAEKVASPKVILDKWINALTIEENYDIIIPTYNNQRCLHLCLESIKACTNAIYNIIVVDCGSTDLTQKYMERRADCIYIRTERASFAKTVNVGVSVSKAKYICLLNDDTIVSKGWLNYLKETCEKENALVNPLSNCDLGWRHFYNIEVDGIKLVPGTNTFEEIQPIVADIYNYKGQNEIKEVDWIAFYCTFMKREMWNKIGILDEKFQNSGEDADYNFRAKKLGYKTVHDFRAFVFHFGAISRKNYEREDKDKYQTEQAVTINYLNEKWNKQTVVIYSGPSWERWDFNNINNGGIGGSEAWVVYLSREFDKLGYRTIVFADCPQSRIKDGNVEWLHYTEYDKFIEQNWIDYFISSRTTDTLRFPIRAGKIYCMIHDIWLSINKEVPYKERVDKFCVLSEWHKEFVKEHHNILEENLWLTQNGIDLTRFESKEERRPYRLIYSSSPDRGLDTLLYLFDFMKKEIPELQLHVFYGFDNWRKAATSRGDTEALKRIEWFENEMKKDGVFNHGRIGQKELAQEFLKSSLWAYSSDFEETFCISSIEAQASGVPVIASNYAGLKTTIGDSGILIGNGVKGESYTKEYRVKFVEECLSLLKNKEKWQYWSEKGKLNAQKYSWENAAKNWVTLFNS